MSERKRQKTITTTFEQFPNELIFNCFGYFDFYHLFQSFSFLNQRFNQLIIHHTKFHINSDSIPDGKLLTFCINLNKFIKKSQNYPLGINISDELKVKLIFNDDLFTNIFSKLKSLSIGNIKIDTLFDLIQCKKIKLYKTLERLSLSYGVQGPRDDVNNVCRLLTSSHMKSLKYLNLNFELYSCECGYTVNIRDDYVDLQIDLSLKKSFSNLETLVIGCIPEGDEDGCMESSTQISFNTLTKNLLPSLPKLKRLLINSLVFNEDNNREGSKSKKKNSIVPLNLEFIKIWMKLNKYNGENAEQKKEIVQNFFLKNNSFPPTTFEIN